jgi:hypothetical protein
MRDESEVQEIMDIFVSLSDDEILEALMRVEILVAEKQNKIVSEGSEYVQ